MSTVHRTSGSNSAAASALSTHSTLEPEFSLHATEELETNLYREKASTHWSKMCASCIVISVFVIAAVGVTNFNNKLKRHSNEFHPLPLEGPFGRPETMEPPTPQTPEQNTTKSQSTVRSPTTVAEATEAFTEPPENYDAPWVADEPGSAAECNSSQCHRLRDWFENTVAAQADPCRERNIFVCDGSIPFAASEAASPKVGSRKQRPPSSYPAPAVDNAAAIKAGNPLPAKHLAELADSCTHYAANPREGVDDVLAFLSHMNLDLRRMKKDTTKHPVAQMMELSLEYGIDALVAFSREYDVTGNVSTCFSLQIRLNQEVEQFFSVLQSLEEDATEEFYSLVLKRYALVNDTGLAEELLEEDEDSE
ncbi:uncharacterized protein LOC144102357 [Amblyomma americanum]